MIGSIALYGQATEANHDPVLQQALKNFRDKFVDADSKLMYQAVDA